MLRSISWLQFSIFLLVVILVYYGWWAWRFVWGPWWRYMQLEYGRGEGLAEQREAVHVAGRENGPKGSHATGEKKESAADEADKEPKRIEGVQEADSIIAELKAGLDEAQASRLDWAAVESGLKRVLSPHGQLRDTPAGESINVFIERTCRAHFGWQLRPQELAELWGGGTDHQGPVEPARPNPD